MSNINPDTELKLKKIIRTISGQMDWPEIAKKLVNRKFNLHLEGVPTTKELNEIFSNPKQLAMYLKDKTC